MRFKFLPPVGVIAAIGVLALGTVGAAYTAFTDTLTVSGSVQTGTFQPRIMAAATAGGSSAACPALAPASGPVTSVSFTLGDNPATNLTCNYTLTLKSLGSNSAKITSAFQGTLFTSTGGTGGVPGGFAATWNSTSVAGCAEGQYIPGGAGAGIECNIQVLIPSVSSANDQGKTVTFTGNIVFGQ